MFLDFKSVQFSRSFCEKLEVIQHKLIQNWLELCENAMLLFFFLDFKPVYGFGAQSWRELWRAFLHLFAPSKE